MSNNTWSKLIDIELNDGDWSIKSISEFGKHAGKSVVNGPFGSDLLTSELRDSGVPVIYSGDFRGGRYVRKKTTKCYVSPSKAKALGAFQTLTDDVILAKVGDPPGAAAVYRDEDDAIVTQDVIRIRPGIDVVSGFLSALLNSDIGKRQVHRIKISGTRGRVSLTDFKKMKLPKAPLAEQRKIADILSTWDQAIEKTEALLSNARTQKRALMQQLLTGKRRFPAFEGKAWKTGEFDDLFFVANDKKTQVNKRDYLPEGVTPVVDQGQNFIVGYTNHEQRYSDIPVIIFGDHTRALKWVDFEFCPGADGTQLLKTKPKLDQRLGYYMLQNLELPNLGYSRHMRELKQSTFDYPSTVEEQSLLATVFSEADAGINLLEGDIIKLRAEKKALMQQLLTGKRRVSI